MDYKPRRKLTREFKLEAVRQVALSEKPKAQVAGELGVRVGQIDPGPMILSNCVVRTRSSRWRSRFKKKAAIYFAREAK